MSTIDKLLDQIKLPQMIRVRQQFERPVVKDVTAELTKKLAAQNVLEVIEPGQRVALAVGSRGITNLPLLVKALIEEIKKYGGEPFIVPAMGSHGGATAEGQKKMLYGMGITESMVGAPVMATMETKQVGVSANGLPVFMDKFAYEADAIVIINRIKPHVGFRGKYESGLMKMITIGLGKQKGADICHELGFGHMAENIPAIARVSLEKTNILFGVAILENAYHETCRIEVMKNREIEIKEPDLQEEAKRLSPHLYFNNLDVLIIDEIGKDISGTGFDNNVVGRYHTPYISGGPNITRISVLDLTDRSHGNANGLGIVDFTTQRVFDKFRFKQTYLNSLTSTVPTSVKIPMVLKNDRQAIQAAIKTCNILEKENVRLVRIKNTLSLSEIEASENLLPEIISNEHLEVLSLPYRLTFNSQGNLF
ncbi:MAG: lactate racemase domain-containing protein [Dehalobacterium sp.]